MQDTDVFYPASMAAWRKWLAKNHLSKQAVWLVFYAKASGKPTITWSEAVDVALCFGWIDSRKVKIDKETSHQYFSKRKSKSTWSKINKEKVQQLIDKGLMTQAGLDSIAIARQNGSWTILDDVERLIIPGDLEEEFRKHKETEAYFLGLSKTAKKMILYALVSARRPETRQRRIAEITELAVQKKNPEPS
jgi:uncharacterized protein YdeI (YjbR/CyaY-like superfamily)